MKNNTLFFINEQAVNKDLLAQLGSQVIKHNDIMNLFTINEFDIDSNIVGYNNVQISQFYKVLDTIMSNKFAIGGNIFVIGDVSNKHFLNIWNKLSTKYNMDYSVVTNLVKNNQMENHQKVIKKYCNHILSVNDFHDFLNKKTHDFIIDASNYKNIYFFGDLQGCYMPIECFFNKNKINNDDLYIFLGDYIDRGIENHLTVDFIRSTIDLDNFIYIKGNHDEYIKNYGLYREDDSPELFINKTLPQLMPHLSRKDALNLYNKFEDLVLLKYHGQNLLLTHAGLAKVPEKPQLLTKKMCIKGYGKYNTEIDKIFSENHKDWVQIHGHRNILAINPKEYSNSFNLEGKVEFGEYLRGIKLHKENNSLSFDVILIKNHVYEVGLLRTKEPKFRISIEEHNTSFNRENYFCDHDKPIFKHFKKEQLHTKDYESISLPANVYKHDLKEIVIVYYSDKSKELKYTLNSEFSKEIADIIQTKLNTSELDLFKRYSAKYNIHFILEYDREEQNFSIITARANGVNNQQISNKDFKDFPLLFNKVKYVEPCYILKDKIELEKFIKIAEINKKNNQHYSIFNSDYNTIVLNKMNKLSKKMNLK